MCERCNDKIGYDEVCGDVMKLNKSPGIDEITIEYLKKGDGIVVVSMREEKEPME